MRVRSALAVVALIIFVSIVSSDVSLAASTIQGRVLEAETNAPLEGFRILLLSPDDLVDYHKEKSDKKLPDARQLGPEVVAETVTDSQGHFSLQYDSRRILRVTVQQPRGWKIVGESNVGLDRPGAAAEEIIFRARRALQAQVQLRMIDHSSGLPVPDLWIEVRPVGSDTAPESLHTDEHGRVVSKRVYEDGPLELTIVDHPALSQENRPWVVHRHLSDGAREYDVLARVGPTYRLVLDLPPQLELGDLSAELYNPAGETNEDDREFVVAPIRSGEPLWVRFHELAGQSMRSPSHPWRLRVATRDGQWSGSEEVDWLWGVHKRVLRIAVRERGSILGRLRDQHNDPIREARVRLDHPDTPLWVTSGERGDFRFERLIPGAYEMSIFSGRHPIEHTTVVVMGGREESITVRLEEPQGRLRIEGRFVSATGLAAEDWSPPETYLRSVSQSSNRSAADVRRRYGDDGAYWTFLVEGVPPDEYVVEYRPTRETGYCQWVAEPHTITSSIEDLRIIRRDDQATADLGFRVFDADRKRELTIASIHFRTYDGLTGAIGINVAKVVFPDYPLDAPLDWSVTSRGYAPVFGNLSDHTEVMQTEQGPVRIARVELDRGWGARVRVTSFSGKPIEGVELKLDDVPFGLTDAEGQIMVYLNQRPTRGEISKPGWGSKRFEGELREEEIELTMTPSP